MEGIAEPPLADKAYFSGAYKTERQIHVKLDIRLSRIHFVDPVNCSRFLVADRNVKQPRGTRGPCS